MGEVRTLREAETPEPDANVIEALENWLQMALEGRITGVVVAGLQPDGLGRYSIAGCVGGYGLLGAVEMARSDIIEFIRED